MNEVVVLMSVYNGAKYLKCQIDSILNQRDVKVRLLVRDDGSSDSSLQLLYQYKKVHGDAITVITGNNIGFARSFSELVKIGLRQYPDVNMYAFADQDDYWHPAKLEAALRQICALRERFAGRPVGYASNTLLVDDSLNPLGLKWKREAVEITKGNCLVDSRATGCTMVFNKEAARLYDRVVPENIRLHDFFMFRLCVFFGKFIWDPEAYISYRQHADNQIGQLPFWGRMRRRIVRHKFLDHVYEYDNTSFLNACRDLLTERDIKLLESFCFYRKSLMGRFKLLFSRRIGIRGFEADFFYRLKVLLGTV